MLAAVADALLRYHLLHVGLASIPVVASQSELTFTGAGTRIRLRRDLRVKLTLKQVHSSRAWLPLGRFGALCLQCRARHEDAFERRSRTYHPKQGPTSLEADGSDVSEPLTRIP